MVYMWKTQGLYKIDPNIAGEEIARCRNEDGYILPHSVVARAKAPDNVLHSCFEWNDDKAAEKWREQEARVLICNLATVVESEEADAAPVTVRAFVNIAGNAERGYKGIIGVLSDANDRGYMLERAISELRSFKAKYKTLTELTGVFAAIEEVAADA